MTAVRGPEREGERSKEALSRPANWRRVAPLDLLILVGLAALTLLYFWKIALTNRVLAGLDVFAYFYPYRAVASEALRAGHLPLWNPYLFMGAPFLANSQAAVLYPFHWPLAWLSAPKQVAWSIVLHIWLAGAGTYLFARLALRFRPLAACTSAAVFALGGFLSAQVEHLNQLNASAWLPWLLLCLTGASQPGRRRWAACLGGGAVVAMLLLAGHTQAAYIVLAGGAMHGATAGLVTHTGARGWQRLRGLTVIVSLAVMTLVGLALAAGQVLPTIELSRLSVRAAGLPYQEAASFSLKPTLLFKALLPPYAWDPPFSEFVAYVGLTGLALLAIGAWTALQSARYPATAATKPPAAVTAGVPALTLALFGLFLAFGAYNPVYYLLYRLVPGFDLFRVPARWLLLFAFGAAILSGIGLQSLLHRRRWHAVLLLLLGLELFIAGRRLAYNHPTTPAAYDSMRTAPAHLLAEQGGEPYRFLSLPGILYDPGDRQDLETMYQHILPPNEVYDFLVASKMKEVLAFNLPMRYGLQAVDGYDGGLLPTARYVTLERLFLEEDNIWPDGRLRQQLEAVPDARLLALLNVRYVITDKTQDLWLDGVYYDVEHTVTLGTLTLDALPDFESTHLGVVSYLTGASALVDGTPVAEVTLEGDDGSRVIRTLRAGEDTAESSGAMSVAHQQPRVAGERRSGGGATYLTVVELTTPLRLRRVTVRSLIPPDSGARVVLSGLSLIDSRSRTSRNLSIDPAFRLVHSGDVKVYENLQVLPRAFVIPSTRVLDDEAALVVLRDPDFDPGSEAILAPDSGRNPSTPAPQGARQIHADAKLLESEPESSRWQVSLDAPGFLVLTDAWYPGWEAQVDGVPVAIERADLYFRAVELDAGTHEVSFHFQSMPIRLGMTLGAVAWLGWGIGALMTLRVGRKRADRL